jgi:DNA ligase-associated metallophosphoesterase
MSSRAHLVIRDEPLILTAQKALVRPARSTLLIADMHIGKDEIFRRQGIAIPAGVVQTDLQRLSALIEEFALSRLVVLGDFLHGNLRDDNQTVAQLTAWCAVQRDLVITLVAGNHDRHRGNLRLPPNIRWREGDLHEPPFVYRHHPAQSEDGYVLAGHVHPVVELQSPARDRLRLPVFWFRERFAVLPSFGSFTGGETIVPQPRDTLYAVGADMITRLPSKPS